MSQIKSKQIKLVAQGDIIIGNASGNGSVLTKGSANQTIVSNGTTLSYSYTSNLRDTNGALVIAGVGVASAVNDVKVTNAATGGAVRIEADGTDTDINLLLSPKGAGAVDLNSHKLVNLSAPTADTDAATKGYVDSVATGLDVKNSVRAGTTVAGTFATSFANGQVIDGVTLVTGDRILIKDQATQTQNGIYIVQASGSPVRSSDADNSPSNEVSGGMFTFIEEGTVNADTGLVLATPNGSATLGTDNLVFAQFSSAGVVVAGAGLTKTGNTIDVVSANGGIVVGSDSITLTLDTNSGLAIGAGGLSAGAGAGLLATAGSIDVVTGAGIQITSDAVAVRLNANAGLVSNLGGGTNELSVNLEASNPSLQLSSNELGIKFNTSGGLQKTASGTGIKLDTNPGLALGAGGVKVVATSGKGVMVTASGVELDINGLTSDTVVDSAADFLPFYDTSATTPKKILISDFVTSLALDTSRIKDTANATFVDTDLVANTVTLNSSFDGTIGNTVSVGSFAAASTTDNSYLAFTSGVAGASVTATGTPTDIDIHLIPKGAGTVILGTPTTSGVISGSNNGAGNGQDIDVNAGNSTGGNGNGGNIVLLAGDKNGTGTAGTISFQTKDGGSAANVLVLDGVASAVNFLTLANAATAGAPAFTATGTDTDISIDLAPKGAGVVTASTVSNADIDAASGTALVTKSWVQANTTDTGYNESTATGGANEVFTSFFTHTPATDAGITVFFNGIALRATAWTRSSSDLTLVDSVIGYSAEAGDILSARYEY